MKLQIIVLAAFCGILAGCSDNDEINSVRNWAERPISLEAQVEDDMALPVTRATSLNSGSFGFFLSTENSHLEKYNASNRKVSYETNTWIIEGNPLYWKDNTTKVSYSAYMPYTPTINDIHNYTISISANQETSGLASSDFLYSKNETTANLCNGILPVNFSHKFSKLAIILQGLDQTGEKKASVTLKETCLTNTSIDLTTGIMKPVPNTEKDIVLKDMGNNRYEGILIPQSAILKVRINYDNKNFYYLSELTTLEEGQTYSLTLSLINPEEIEQVSFKAEGWDTTPADEQLEVEG